MRPLTVLLTASGTPGVLRSVKTLDDLVGADPLTAPQQAATRALPGVQAVVIGDSTAAAIGNPHLPNGTPLDRACGRSSVSYAADLAMVNNWTVLNLACSGATVQNGLLGAQVFGSGTVAPPQLVEAQRATKAKVIIVSVGADDVQRIACLEPDGTRDALVLPPVRVEPRHDVEPRALGRVEHADGQQVLGPRQESL